MSSKKWFLQNQGRIALTAAVLALGAWGCQTATPVATDPTGTDAVLKSGAGGQATAGKPAEKVGSQEAVPYTNPVGDPSKPATTTQPGTPAVGEGKPGANPGTAPDPTNVANAVANGGATLQPNPNAARPSDSLSGGLFDEAPKLPMNLATVNKAPIKWNVKAVATDPEVAKAFPKGEATFTGRVVDQFGKPAAGVPVTTDKEVTTTNAEGFYTLKVDAAPDAAIRIGGNEAGFVPFDDFVGVFPGEARPYNTQVLRLDENVTTIDVTKGGIAKSSSIQKVLGEQSSTRPVEKDPTKSFGLLQIPAMANGLSAVYLEVPPGGLRTKDGSNSTNVTLTWLNPLPRDGKPFGDLYGPLQTQTAWDAATQSGKPGSEIIPFAPVNFSDLDLGGATITPGAEIKVKWVVGPEVLAKYPIQMINGQAFMPCYQYDEGSGWTKPVLATVFQENGYTWTQYTMRGSNPPPVVPD